MNGLGSKFLLATFILLASCQAYKEKRAARKDESENVHSQVAKDSTESKPLNNNILNNIVIDKMYQWKGATDAFNILEQNINGDTLKLVVEYGGGCKDHVFTMNTNSARMKSMPPKLNLWLEHESNDDNCRALITESLFFDLKPIRYNPSQSVVIIVNGEEENSVLYRY